MTNDAGETMRDTAAGLVPRSLLLSRLASLGAAVTGVAALGRLFLAVPADAADVLTSLLLLFAAAHLALLGIVSWLYFDEPLDDLRRAGAHGDRLSRAGALEATPRAAAREAGAGATAPASCQANGRVRAA